MATTYAVDLKFSKGDFSALQALEQRLYKIENLTRDGIGGAQPFKPVEDGAKRAAGTVERLKSSFTGLQGALAGLGAGLFLRDLAQTGQAAANASRQLKFLSDEFGEYAQAQEAVVRVQKQLGLSSTDATKGIADLYAALRPTGTTLRDIESAFVGFNKAARRSGATAAEASAGALQLKQALGSGVLQGDELRSLREQAPALSQAIAKAMGISVGELKKFGEQGKITSAIVIKALKDLETGSAPPLTAIDRLNTAFTELKTSIAGELGPATSAAVGALASLLEGFQKLPPAVQGPIKDVLTFGLVITGLATAFGGLLVVLPLVTAGLAAFVAVLAPIAVPAAIVGGIVLLTKAAYDLNEPFKQFINDIPAKFMAFWESIRSQSVTAIERLTKAWQAFVDFFTAAMGEIRKAAEFAFGGIIGLMKPLAPAAQAIGDAMRIQFASAFSLIQENWRQTVENMINYSNPLTAALKLIGIDVGAAATGAIGTGSVFNSSTTRALPSNINTVGTSPIAASTVLPSVARASGGGGGGGKSQGLTFSGGSQNERIVFDSLVKRGYNKPQIAAIMGSLAQESSFNPYAKEPSPGTGLGLFQWSFDRRNKVPAFTGNVGTDINRQLDLFEKELSGPEARAGRTLRGASTLPQAALGMKQFERYGIAGNRYKYMDQYMSKIGGTFTGGGGGSSNASITGVDDEAARQARLTDLKADVKYGNDALRIEERINTAKLASNRIEEALGQNQLERLAWQKEYDDIVRNTLDADERKLKLAEQSIKLQKINRDNVVELVQIQIAEQEKINALMVEKARLAEGALRPVQDEIDLLQAQLSGTEELLGKKRELAKLTNAGVAPDAARGLIAQRDDLRQQREAQLKSPGYILTKEIATRQEKLDALMNPANQLISAADSIGSAFGQAFQDIASGSKTAGEALSGMFQSIAASFLDMAAQMLAQQAVLAILGAFTGGLGGGADPFARSRFGGRPQLFAEGGIPPVGKASIVGEEGPELFIPGVSGTIVPNDMVVPYSEGKATINPDGSTTYNASYPGAPGAPGSRGASGIGGQGRAGNSHLPALTVPFQKSGSGDQTLIQNLTESFGRQLVEMGSIKVAMDTTVINGMEFVTPEQAQQGNQEAAQQGAKIALAALQNSVGTRRKIGL
jgi:tape measure domain-containing protein